MPLTIKRDDWRRYETPVGDRKACMVCPKCATEMALGHEISSEGVVTPSVVCPVEGCGFHDYVILEDWEAT